MIQDDVLREVRTARETYARSHSFDIQAILADLRSLELPGDWLVVRHPPRRPNLIAAPMIPLAQVLPRTEQV